MEALPKSLMDIWFANFINMT